MVGKVVTPNVDIDQTLLCANTVLRITCINYSILTQYPGEGDFIISAFYLKKKNETGIFLVTQEVKTLDHHLFLTFNH